MCEQHVEEILASLSRFRYPRYDELPDGLVFLDEIVEIVNEVHAPIPASARNNKKRFTTSMASNYIKKGLTPPPVGKKYTRDHICLILLASTLKLAYSAEDVLAITHILFAMGEAKAVHDDIAEAMEGRMASMVDTLGTCKDPAQTSGALTGVLAGACAAKTVSLAVLPFFDHP